MIPLELGIPSFQTIVFNEAENERAFHEEFDLIEEKRNEVEKKNAIYKQQSQLLHLENTKNEILKLVP